MAASKTRNSGLLRSAIAIASWTFTFALLSEFERSWTAPEGSFPRGRVGSFPEAAVHRIKMKPRKIFLKCMIEIGRDGSSRRMDFRRGEVVATHRAEGRDDVADGKNGVPPGPDRARQRLGYLRRMFDRVRFRVRRKLTEHGKANSL
jgi:hypothetical protein